MTGRVDVAVVGGGLAGLAAASYLARAGLHSDTGGEFHAAHRVIEGRWRVARLFLGLSRKQHALGARVELRLLNGLPALVLAFERVPPKIAPRVVIRCEVDEGGKIVAIDTVLATRKLAGVRP